MIQRSILDLVGIGSIPSIPTTYLADLVASRMARLSRSDLMHRSTGIARDLDLREHGRGLPARWECHRCRCRRQ
jgi:hypothetical protein